MMCWFFTMCLLLTALHCSSDAHADDIAELRARADQGDASAQYSLGLMYDNGEGVVQDSEQAVVWYRKAADQGVARDQNNLGLMYRNGKGVVQNYVQAHKWFNLAAANSTGEDYEQAARNRSRVEKKMTPQQTHLWPLSQNFDRPSRKRKRYAALRSSASANRSSNTT